MNRVSIVAAILALLGSACSGTSSANPSGAAGERDGGSPTGAGGAAGTGGGTAGTTDDDGGPVSGEGSSSGGSAGGLRDGGPPREPTGDSAVPAGRGWTELVGTKLADVCACTHGFPDVCGNSQCAGIFAWSSGVFDTLRDQLVVWGGGHGDYAGNEVYALDLSKLDMQRLTDPGLPVSTDCGEAIAGGAQPNSRHTYDGLSYMENVDRMFVLGGSKHPCGYMSDGTWTLGLVDMTWQKMSPKGTIPQGGPGIVSAYDKTTGNVFVHDASRLYSYDYTNDAYQQLSGEYPIDYHMSAVIDPVRKRFLIAGSRNVYAYDIGPGSAYERKTLATHGGDPLVASAYPGLAYDPVADRIVGWNGGDSVYQLNLDDLGWTADSPPGGPGEAVATGTYKRFAYSEKAGAFIVVNGAAKNAFAYRP
jgi:hypothetical protein